MATLVLSVVGGSVGGPIGQAVGSFLGNAIDNALFSKDTRLPDQIGPRLNDLKVQLSTYGEFVPQIFGVMRLGGNVIWANNLREVEIREEQSTGGGKGGGGGSATQTSIRYEYYATLAIAICEGECDEVLRVWADSKPLSIDDLQEASDKYEVHLGSETQLASDIIKNHSDDTLNVPAYRGTCYVVIEDFPLAAYGNRIPNFTFEVRRTVRPTPSVEDLVKEITLIPGSGEYVYSTTLSKKYSVTLDEAGNPVQTGTKTNANMHNFDGIANVNKSLDQLQDTFPNLEWVAVVVNWFITSKDMGTGEVIPKIEFATNRVEPNGWQVGSFNRDTAEELELFPDGSLTYGGTPTDKSIIELLTELKDRGLNVMLYPMPLVDTVDETVGEDDKPWRGRLVPASAAQCNSWFTKTNGYNAFIRHYSQLSVDGVALKDKIDAFVIGSELVGITTYDSGSNTYPGVSNLVTLAGLVKADMPSVAITYAADWTEYHSVGGYYHLDDLWKSANIDFIGIDNYMPLTPDLDQSDITEDKIKQYWEDGEGWAYYYSDAVARTGKTDYVPNDGTSIYAWKNIEQWWNLAHFHNGDAGSPTGWTAKMKPVWFTEFGFPSVDGGTNQPNVFVDPTSIESYYPRGSKRRIDFLAQRKAINATLEFWKAKNAETGNGDLVPRTFLWTWDARPYPFWPDLLDVWADGGNWKTGHWVNGKMGVSNLGAIIADLLSQVGYAASDYDVTALIDPVEGYVINGRQTIRQHLEVLKSLFFFDMVESDGVMKFVKRGGLSLVTIDEDELIPTDRDDVREAITITRRQELELPQLVDVQYINRVSNYQSATQTAQRSTGSAVDKLTVTAPVVMADDQAKTIADVALYSQWYGRNLFECMVPPKYAYLEPTDIITLTVNNVNYAMRIVSTDYARGGQQKIHAISENLSTYDFYTAPGETPPNPEQNTGVPLTQLQLLDLPPFPTDTDQNGTLRLAIASEGVGWRGAAVYSSDDGGESGGNSFAALTSGNSQAVMGSMLNALPVGARNNWDNANEIKVALLTGELSSKSELAVLNGANACLIGNEVIQFKTATLVSSGVYTLTGLLRGRLGTEHEIDNHVIGDRFIFMDSAVLKESIPLFLIGIESYYKPVTVGATVADTDEQAFTYAGVKFKPFSPVDIEGTRDGSDNLTITWKRRTRLNGQWRDGVDVPLSEESESYEIDIMDGVSVVRTLTSTTPTIIYTAAQQVADFGITQTSVDAKIVQMSAIVGRGTAGEASI